MQRLSQRYSRRKFLALAGAGMVAMAAGSGRGLAQIGGGQIMHSGSVYRELSGSDLTGWRVTLGDGNYAAPGQDPVSLQDIETRHGEGLSEVRANTRKREIMAHNITYLRERDEHALDYTHRFTCEFRLPYLPSVSNTEENAQTLEAGLFVWDGLTTMLDCGMAFQWGLNPYERFGEVRSSIEGVSAAAWEPVGYLEPDTEWHTFTMMVNYPNQTTLLQIDDITYTSYFVGFPKRWPAAISAGIQVEAISIYPRGVVHGALHRVEYRNWLWQWITLEEHQLYLPNVMHEYSAGSNVYLPFVTTDSSMGAASVETAPVDAAPDQARTYIPFVAHDE